MFFLQLFFQITLFVRFSYVWFLHMNLSKSGHWSVSVAGAVFLSHHDGVLSAVCSNHISAVMLVIGWQEWLTSSLLKYYHNNLFTEEDLTKVCEFMLLLFVNLRSMRMTMTRITACLVLRKFQAKEINTMSLYWTIWQTESHRISWPNSSSYLSAWCRQCLTANNLTPVLRDGWNASHVCLSYTRRMRNTASITVTK